MAGGYVGHYVFWKTGVPIEPVGATVKGQFGKVDIKLNQIHMLGNPAVKDGEPFDPQYAYLHLTGYELDELPAIQATVLVSNHFGAETWQLGKPVMLLVPAYKGHGDPLPRDLPKGPHFLCYHVLDGPTVNRRVTLKDQFAKQGVKSLTPAYLGVPVDKNGEGMWNERIHLALYEIDSFQLDPVQGVFIKDQFHEQKIEAMISVFLGVPSTKKVL